MLPLSELEVGAVIVDDLETQAEKRAVLSHRKLRVVEAIWAYVVVGGQVVDAILDELDRATGGFGQRAGDGEALGDQVLTAKAAADQAGLHLQPVGRYLQ